MSDNDFVNSVMNDGTDLKECLQNYFHDTDLMDNPLALISIDSPYLDIEDIPTKIPPDIGFSYKTLHINIHSVPDKIDKLREMLAQFLNVNIEFDFILLCEAFMKDNTMHLYNLSGYTLVCNNRQMLIKGGVAIYIRDSISYKVREDISVFYEGEFETIFIETTGCAHRTIVGEVYRIPNTSEIMSIDRFESLLSKLQQTGSDIIIGTYQNFDYLKIDSQIRTLDLLNLFISSNMIPTITKPTRVTHTSATLIDNIYVRHDTQAKYSGIIPFNISDHFPVFCLLCHKENRCKAKSPLTFIHRPINSDALAQIRTALIEHDWIHLVEQDVNSAYAYFTDQLNAIVSRCAPEKKWSYLQSM